MSDQAAQTRCLRCGRKLTAQSSVTAGYGRACRARIVAAAAVTPLPGFSDEQKARVAELIGDKGVVPTGHVGVWRTVSSKGDGFYLTDALGHCNCRAGLRGIRCYHAAAVAIVAASLGRAA